MSRDVGEAVRIGDDIVVKVLGVQGMSVRLAIQAPRSVAVDRAEVAKRKRAGIASPRPKDEA